MFSCLLEIQYTVVMYAVYDAMQCYDFWFIDNVMLSWVLVCLRCNLIFSCLIEKDVMFIIYFDILLIHYNITVNTHKTQSHYTLDDVMGAPYMYTLTSHQSTTTHILYTTPT